MLLDNRSWFSYNPHQFNYNTDFTIPQLMRLIGSGRIGVVITYNV